MSCFSRFLSFLTLLTVSTVGLPAWATTPVVGSYQLPVPSVETLANGLKVVWFVSDALPVVDLSLVIQSGYRDDPSGKAGTAELVAAVLDRGNAGMSAQEIAHAVEKLGASRYAGVDEDSFSVGMHGLAPDASTLVDLLAKVALAPAFPEAEVKRERERILDGWSHLGDYGDSLASLAYNRLIASGTTYGRGNFTSIKEFSKVKRDDVLQYYKNHFTPANAVLLVVGRVDRHAFAKKIEESFGAWKGEAPVRAYTNYSDRRLPKVHKGQIVLVDRPGLTQAQLRIGFRAPSIHAPEHYALVVANALLGEYYNSRLNSLIRDKLALTYSIVSAFTYSKDFAEFTISTSTRNDSVGQLIRRTADVLRNLKSGPISYEEVQTAKDYLVGGFPLGTSTLESVASRWVGGFLFGLDANYLNEFVPKVQEVTPQDVLAAMGKDIDLDQLTIVIAGDAAEISKSLSASGLAPVAQVSIQDLM